MNKGACIIQSRYAEHHHLLLITTERNNEEELINGALDIYPHISALIWYLSSREYVTFYWCMLLPTNRYLPDTRQVRT